MVDDRNNSKRYGQQVADLQALLTDGGSLRDSNAECAGNTTMLQLAIVDKAIHLPQQAVPTGGLVAVSGARRFGALFGPAFTVATSVVFAVVMYSVWPEAVPIHEQQPSLTELDLALQDLWLVEDEMLFAITD